MSWIKLLQGVGPVLFATAIFVQADDVLFPLQADIVDVTAAPYNAKGDGKTDDTEALQKALNDHPNGNYIIYLPQGTYLVSRTLIWPKGTDTAGDYRRTILQGQNSTKTIVRLAPKSEGFGNPNIPKAVIYTGLGPAPRWRNSVRDLTLRIGPGNPGAVGIRFNAAIQGTIHDVNIIAEDKQGIAGIDMSFAPFIGPLLVKNVEVQGFDYGILTGSPYNGMTLEHVTVQNQHKAGLFNQGQMVTIRNFTCKGNVPGIRNLGPTATLTLVDSKFDHTREGERGPAIVNEGGYLFVRNTAVSGYGISILDDQGPGQKSLDIYEYTSQPSLQICSSPKQSLNLPIAETPPTTWGYVGNWVAISGDYGGSRGDGTDDSKAIQEAIDDGAEVIFFNPGGRYTINKDVHIRKNVRCIIGVEARIDGIGKFLLENGVSPRVTIERFENFGAGIIQNSARSLVLKDMSFSGYDSKELGAGDLFLEDVSITGPMHIHYQKVWGRQVHLNYDQGTQISNHGGMLWILGLTATRGQRILYTHQGGMTEILGAHIIAGPGAKLQPMFTNDTASFSIAGLRESAPNGNEYATLIAEERPDLSPVLRKDAVPRNASGARTIPLFTGYVPLTGINLPPKVEAGKDQLVVLPGNVALTGKADDDGRGSGLCGLQVEWNKVAGEGRVSYSHPKELSTWTSFSYAGVYSMQLAASDGKLTRYDTTRIVAWDRCITPHDHNGDHIPSGRGADAAISEEHPDQNFGRSPEIFVQNYPGISSKMLLRFDLSALPGPITDAALQCKLHPRKDSLPVAWNVYGLKESPSYDPGKQGELWKEDSVTWNNAPGNEIEVGGGYYDTKTHSGGGADSRSTVYLGSFTQNKEWPFGYYFQSKALVKFLRQDSNKLATILLTAEGKYPEPDIAAASETSKIENAPCLYLNYIDPNRSVGGEVIPGGFRMSEVQVDPFSLQVSFSLLVANPQIVKIEVYNEQGRRVMLVNDQHMDAEKLTQYQFNAKDLETGSYKIKIKGEAFSGEKDFVLLN